MLPWPAYSPDISPIEHVWDVIGHRLQTLPLPRSNDQLCAPQRISWLYFEAIDSTQIVTIKKSNHQRLDDGMRWRIVGRLEAGQCQVQICREFNLTYGNSSRILDPSREKSGQGHPRPTTAREDRHLSIIARRKRGTTASQLSLYLYSATGIRVSRMTASKRLYERGLFGRRPAVGVPLTSTNSRVRLA
ncbi:HTH_Tnp_Tc3_2 domain-containing protein [Trichonephila clavipes]|nr:HTH_Tnp_Tc3_2 domain-containing protein [Trichonephila clavipes]